MRLGWVRNSPDGGQREMGGGENSVRLGWVRDCPNGGQHEMGGVGQCEIEAGV